MHDHRSELLVLVLAVLLVPILAPVACELGGRAIDAIRGEDRRVGAAGLPRGWGLFKDSDRIGLGVGAVAVVAAQAGPE